MQHFTYKKHGGRLFRLSSSSLATELKPFPFTLLRTLLRRKKINSFVFKRFRTLYRKTQGWGYPYPWGLCLSNGGVCELEDPGPAGTGWVCLPRHSLYTVGCQPIRGEEGAPC